MKEAKLLSFHNDPAIKEKYINRLKLHYKADEIIKGKYWENGKGCAVGCTIHSNKHDNYDTELGITWRLALLEDSLFERLPNDQAKEFPLQFLEACPVGVDTNIVFKKFIIWNLSDKQEGLINIIKGEKQIDLLKRIADTYKQSLKKETPNEVWAHLDKDAHAASASTYAFASTYAYASASTYAYASASTCAFAYASASAYAYAYDSKEWQDKLNERILRMRDVLLELLKNAK